MERGPNARAGAAAGIHGSAGNRPGMSRGVAVICTLAAGGLVALQPPVNAVLARHVGDFGAAFISLAISIAIIGVLLLLVGHPGRLSGLGAFKLEYLLGGIARCRDRRRIAGRGATARRGRADRAARRGAAAGLGARGSIRMVRSARVAIGPARVVGLVLVIGGTVLITR